jgi:hypothetical protein
MQRSSSDSEFSLGDVDGAVLSVKEFCLAMNNLRKGKVFDIYE